MLFPRQGPAFPPTAVARRRPRPRRAPPAHRLGPTPHAAARCGPRAQHLARHGLHQGKVTGVGKLTPTPRHDCADGLGRGDRPPESGVDEPAGHPVPRREEGRCPQQLRRRVGPTCPGRVLAQRDPGEPAHEPGHHERLVDRAAHVSGPNLDSGVARRQPHVPVDLALVRRRPGGRESGDPLAVGVGGAEGRRRAADGPPPPVHRPP